MDIGHTCSGCYGHTCSGHTFFFQMPVVDISHLPQYKLRQLVPLATSPVETDRQHTQVHVIM